MKGTEILLLGGACLLGIYLLRDRLGDFDLFGGGGGGGGGGGLGELDISPGETPFSPGGGTTPGYRGYTNTGTGAAPAAYEVTHVTPITTKVQLTGGRVNVFQSSPGSTRAALLTIGTPSQQIQQFNVAPKIVMINGRATKVM
jgi:hypothetical protein